MMKKMIIYSFIVFSFIMGCKVFPPPPPKLPTPITIDRSYLYESPYYRNDSILRWKLEGKKYKDSMINNFPSVHQVKNRYKIIDGLLYDKNEDEIVSNVGIVLYLGDFQNKSVDIIIGSAIGVFHDTSYGKIYNHDMEGNISGNYFVGEIYETKFNAGNGYWKDFYYDKTKETYSIKEEGRVKNNFKYGKWKYYNQLGTIDSIKSYTLKDSVDVRFPHCLFNKIEPCY